MFYIKRKATPKIISFLLTLIAQYFFKNSTTGRLRKPVQLENYTVLQRWPKGVGGRRRGYKELNIEL
jgi:hypothetical protein